MTILISNYIISVGVQPIDDQHGILKDLLSELRQAVFGGADREKMDELLDRMVAFSQMHFSTEEALMEKVGFCGLEAHRAEHQHMLEHVNKQAQKLRHGQPVQLADLTEFLRLWFKQHNEGPDLEYGLWMNEHVVPSPSIEFV